MNEMQEEAAYNEAMNTLLCQTSLKVRTVNSLEKGGINTVRQLLNTPPSKLRTLDNFGTKSIDECLEALAKLGFVQTAEAKPEPKPAPRPPKPAASKPIHLRRLHELSLSKKIVDKLWDADIRIVDDVLEAPQRKLLALLTQTEYLTLRSTFKSKYRLKLNKART